MRLMLTIPCSITVAEHTPKGKLVGTDSFGNKYYENRDLPYGAAPAHCPPMPAAARARPKSAGSRDLAAHRPPI
jgi:hypothetical protein